MRVTVFGTGYVGLVTGVCLAEIGHQVICVDIDDNKIATLQRGESPIFEPQLPEFLQRNLQAGNILFTTDAQTGIEHGDYIFIAVGTPPLSNGAADLKYVFEVATKIGHTLDHDSVVINKSTVPVGTLDKVQRAINVELKKRGVKLNVALVSNPEFLKQGDAINDFMQASRIVVGADEQKSIEKMRALYKQVIDLGQQFIAMDIRSAELTKYAANVFLANRISLVNEISRLAECFGADIEEVRKGVGSDPRVGPDFLRAGCGYGGSCFPKDVNALISMAEECGQSVPILHAIEQVNSEQKMLMFEKLRKYFLHDLHDKNIALWGLAFKPDTDDMREAPSRVLLEKLWQVGANIQAYDPAAMQKARDLYGERPDFILCESASEALDNADALVIVTEWNEFKSADLHLIKNNLKNPVIFDGRNIFPPEDVRKAGIEYYCIGRSR